MGARLWVRGASSDTKTAATHPGTDVLRRGLRLLTAACATWDPAMNALRGDPVLQGTIQRFQPAARPRAPASARTTCIGRLIPRCGVSCVSQTAGSTRD